MKLTLNRTEEQKAGIFKKSTVYHLDVNLDVTPQEMALIKKHKWDDLPFCEGMFLASRAIEFSVGDVEGKAKRFSFKSVNELAAVEKQVIGNAKNLKQQIEAAAGFTSRGRARSNYKTRMDPALSRYF